MLKITHTALLLTLLGAGTAFAADTKVIDHHLTAIKAGNLEGVLSDYAPDVVIVTTPGMLSPDGVFIGPQIRKMFATLTDKDHLPGVKTLQTRYQAAGADTTIMHWVQEKGTAKEVSGYDVFVVRGGKIVFQSVTLGAAKK